MNTFSKIIESSIFDQLSNSTNFRGSLQKTIYSSQHIIIRLIEEWKTLLDKNKIVGAVLLDLSNAFDCIPHDLLIAKLDACAFDNEALSLFH